MLCPTYQDLRQVLLALGFHEEALPAGQARFRHPPTGTVLVFRPYHPDEVVDEAMVVGARRLLDERGVVARDELEKLLHQRSLAG